MSYAPPPHAWSRAGGHGFGPTIGRVNGHARSAPTASACRAGTALAALSTSPPKSRAARSDTSGFLLININHHIRNGVLQESPTGRPPPRLSQMASSIGCACLVNAMARTVVPAWIASPCCSTRSLFGTAIRCNTGARRGIAGQGPNVGSAPDRLCKGESSAINPTTTSTTTQIWKKAKHAPLTRDIVGLAHTHPLKHLAETPTSQGLSG